MPKARSERQTGHDGYPGYVRSTRACAEHRARGAGLWALQTAKPPFNNRPQMSTLRPGAFVRGACQGRDMGCVVVPRGVVVQTAAHRHLGLLDSEGGTAPLEDRHAAPRHG